MEYNIYCDESCHLPHDNSNLMVIGGLSCPKDKVNDINKRIFDIKRKYGIHKYAEIKWTKVSKSKYEYFKELVDLFFESDFLNFRAVVALNKKELDYARFNLTHDDWYQRIYYLVLREMITIGSHYYVYVDIKDSKGSEKIDKLREVLNNVTGYFYDETVKNIQLVRSDQIQILQLADLLIGAVSYANRGLNSNPAKVDLISYIEHLTRRSMTRTTDKREAKFNIFRWTPRHV